MASAASSMNCCGLRLKSSSRPLPVRMRQMMRRVSCVRSCRSVSRSGNSISSSSSTTVWPPRVQLPPRRPCRWRYPPCAIAGAFWRWAVLPVTPNAILQSAFRCRRHAVGRLVLDPVPQRLEFRALSTACRVSHLLAFIRVLDFQPPATLLQYLGDLVQLRLRRLPALPACRL